MQIRQRPQRQRPAQRKRHDNRFAAGVLQRYERVLGPVAARLHGGALGLAAAVANWGSGEPVRDERRSLKITFLIINAYGMGGTIRTVLNLAGYLADEHDVEVISIVRRRTDPFFPFPPGITVRTLDDQRKDDGAAVRLLRNIPSILVHPQDFSYKGSSLWRDLLLVRALRSLRHGVLITTRPGLNLLAAELGRPDVVRVGQEHLNFGAYKPRLAADIVRRYPKLDALAVLSEDDRRTYEGAFRPGRPRVVFIPNAIPKLGDGLADPANRVVVAAGRLMPQKGFDRLIPAFAQVVQHHPDWKLRIFGSGPKRNELQKLIAEHGVAASVALMGRASDLGSEFAKGSIFALSSRFEGMPMVLLEAMSKRLPVVSFDCPTGPRQLVTSGHNGLLVPNGDIDEFAAALRELIEDGEKRARMGAAAAETASRHALEVVGQQWVELLHELDDARAVGKRVRGDRQRPDKVTLDRV
jgi:glycosyltransferase involved in cell wall biosynthesis